MKLRISASLLLLLAASTAGATNTTSVFSPEVKEGSRAFEYRFSGADESADFDMAHRFHYQQAINDAWRWRIISQFSDPDQGDVEYRYSRLELQWQFLESEEAGWDSALRFEFQLADGDDEPSRGRVAWTSKWNFDKGLELRHNFLTGQQWGPASNDGWLLENRFQATVPVTDKIRVGFEMFNDFNDHSDVGSWSEQEHQLGPILKTKIGDDTKLLFSWLIGASDSADDHDFRMHLTRAF